MPLFEYYSITVQSGTSLSSTASLQQVFGKLYVDVPTLTTDTNLGVVNVFGAFKTPTATFRQVRINNPASATSGPPVAADLAAGPNAGNYIWEIRPAPGPPFPPFN